MPEEAYTLSTVFAAVEEITLTARMGGDRWELLWGSIQSEYSAYHVERIFGQDDWFVAFVTGKRPGMATEAFELLEVVCEGFVTKAGMFTRHHVGV